ncbi:hypothetical protein D8T49_24215 [Vibrio vulnificus]|nr:hypothetical protein D8T37_23745 [Vibrio vulnificus]RZQ41706.1 hypothetical protein D8T49_24215 [Vibrio vulnificus]
MLNAWHFQFDSALVVTAQWFRLGGGVVHPLTRRYKALLNLVPLPTCVGELHFGSAASIVVRASSEIRAICLGCLCQ